MLTLQQAQAHAAQCGCKGTAYPLAMLPDTFLAGDDVGNPETLEPLILAGFRYTRAQALTLGAQFGIDYLTVET